MGASHSEPHKNSQSPEASMKLQQSIWLLFLSSFLNFQGAAFAPASLAQTRTRRSRVAMSDDEVVESTTADATTTPKKKIAVVGGGWGGWGAAKALCQAKEDIEVTLLDALPDPTGLTPYLSKTGKPGTTGQLWIDTSEFVTWALIYFSAIIT